MNLPNFILIGAYKAGSTAIYQYLNEHPQVYMSPIKELNFWGIDTEHQLKWQKWCPARTIEEYKTFFNGVSDEIALGEASPSYMYIPECAERIKKSIPEVKLIAILRNPVDRAYAHFLFNQQKNMEEVKDFAKVLELERTVRLPKRWGPVYYYQDYGLYYNQIQRYFDTFDRSQIRVYLYDDLKKDSLGLLQNIFGFLGVDQNFVPDLNTKHTVGGIPKNQAVDQFLSTTNHNLFRDMMKLFVPKGVMRDRLNKIRSELRKKNLVKPPLSPEIAELLKQEYREDILKLQDLIQRDLSMWLA